MSSNLARGQWLPSCLDFKEESIVPSTSENGGKLYADIIESLLGLVYLEFGYRTAMDVGDELKVTVASSDLPPEEPSGKANVDVHLLETVRRATGYADFRRLRLLEEAFAHPSAGNPNVSSFERLEWVGDAVLCLAAREWIWNNFSELELSEMVTMESAIVSNEVLSFLSVQTGLHHFLEHKDYTLPGRIESYITSIKEDGSGLWGAEPPKSIADIVESLFGAIYTDGGISQGLRAASNMLAPVCNALLKRKQENKKICLTHPKKALQALMGEVLELETAWENEFAVEQTRTQVLDGTAWRLADPFSSNAVGYVHFMESILVAVSDPSATVARNKACALIVQALQTNPTILEHLQELRHRVESVLASKARSANEGEGYDLNQSAFSKE
jgi:dsRNA-specific ribonuclease